MKLNENYILKDFAGEYVLVRQDESSVDFSKVITLNGMGVFIYHLLEKGMNEEEIVDSILKEYDVERSVAEKDVKEFLGKMEKIGILHE